MAERPFVIYAGPFDETMGGVLVLHELCARLNQLGYRASIWPAGKPASPLRLQPAALPGYLRRGGARGFNRGPNANPLASRADLADGILVYPEIIGANPLGAPRVVRWFLNRPGFFFENVRYGKDDIFFFYNPAFDDPAINPDPDNFLRVTYLHPAYQCNNEGQREGACYIVRKGEGRTLDRHPPEALRIDALSHEEKAAAFNRCACLYSYDPYTFYTTYAAICGCVPIVIPAEGVTKAQWAPDPELALGHAYGEGEVDWARMTRGAMLEMLARRREEEDALVHRFAATCRAHFAGTGKR